MSIRGRAGALASSAAVVIAALAVGRFVADNVETGITDKPFERHAGVGQKVHLRLGDVTVERVSVADTIVLFRDAFTARGVFLVIDVTARGRGETDTFAGVMLEDSAGRLYGEASARVSCSGNIQAEPGVTTYARLCFDVPVSVVDDVHLQVANNEPALMGGSGQRRDDLAIIDLGLSPGEATRLVDADLALLSHNSVFSPPDPAPQPAPGPDEEES